MGKQKKQSTDKYFELEKLKALFVFWKDINHNNNWLFISLMTGLFFILSQIDSNYSWIITIMIIIAIGVYVKTNLKYKEKLNLIRECIEKLE